MLSAFLGGNLEMTDDYGQKPIHLAAQSDQPAVVSLFLQKQPALVSTATRVSYKIEWQIFCGYLSICQSVYLSICLSVILSFCQSVSLSIYLSFCHYVILSVFLSIDLSVYLSLSINLFVYLSFYPSVYQSACLSIYLSIYLFFLFAAYRSYI